MHLTDTLDLGGRERIAVELANRMPREQFETSICTTRRNGPLVSVVREDVGRICLHRTRMIEPRAIRELARYIRDHRVDLLHVHGSAILIARLAAGFCGHPTIVWHDHFGTNDRAERPAWLYRLLMRRVDGILAVSQSLADWSRDRLRFPGERVWCLPNCVNISSDDQSVPTDLPGTSGSRIVCVANLRPVKDHLTLIRAFGTVASRQRDAHLLLVGAPSDQDCHQQVLHEIERLGLADRVSLLGQRTDVPAILRGCDIGVLSSRSEGLPVSLLEYGAAGLAVAATRVGQCSDVLDDGRAGIIVPPESAPELGEAIHSMLADSPMRQSLASQLHQRVADRYSTDAVIGQLSEIYETVLGRR
jgi:glycosyltransferase involved in cell wall biosynthesis